VLRAKATAIPRANIVGLIRRFVWLGKLNARLSECLKE